MEEKMKECDHKNGQDSFTIFKCLSEPMGVRK